MNVLIVDDDLSFGILLKGELEEYDIDSSFSTNVNEALELLHNHSFNVLISDIKMDTELEGITFIEEAKRIDPTMGVLIITGHDADFKWAYKTPGIGRLTKPYQKHDVLFALKLMCEPPTIEDAEKILDELTVKINDTTIDTRSVERKLNRLRSAILENGMSEQVRMVGAACQRIEVQIREVESNLDKRIGDVDKKFDKRIDEVCGWEKWTMRFIWTGLLGGVITIAVAVLKEVVFK